ncbi:histidinol-phosphatase [Corynebacterium glucuronolyticum]|uniref:Histidinol-phosphatase n=2 Tax=Corynebacterium glucuronolyticum TaxID=39791 RepID=A0A7T4JUV2_9CORY|nr:histidinol-phosphatase [Corynebacterium glucuronolyticum]EEI63382.1 histidinol-phosphate phosphatase HisN [Corynebacterium glucuronolyticum ATCC 51866]QQB46246.1 histidinol-phosphatase [Corynebacterium glucuronolyticum]QRP71289.1 histidinol-phosphatase [Corynebacterium glucuronolyticum]WKD62994.1 Histidinol-phosphatase [Corynebacterium glucuronolyticum DSM 44120]SMB85616.1 inositol-phosphate phosphatase [Corynebacterium glucuronolyticum]
MLKQDLALAISLAEAADAITLDRFQAQDLNVATKPDLTPVSDADLAVEKTLRGIIERERPDDDILGEEYGGTPATTGRQWVIDPIDGTKSFVRGVPIWATLIALCDGHTPVLGVVSAPALSRRWWATDGGGAFLNGSPLHVSKVSTLADASLGFSSLSGWADRGLREKFVDLTDAVWRIRGYGDFWSYCLVAEGAIDIATEPEVNLWDLAALDILVREAGGTFTSLDGEPGPYGGSAVATNGLLHADVLRALR